MTAKILVQHKFSSAEGTGRNRGAGPQYLPRGDVAKALMVCVCVCEGVPLPTKAVFRKKMFFLFQIWDF